MQALVGVDLGQDIVYNIIQSEGEFKNSGLSIINWLNHNPNKFVSKIFQSQSYDSIEYIFNNEIKFGSYFDYNNKNIDTFKNIYKLIRDNNDYEYFYIYDFHKDVLIIKTPFSNLYVLDYKEPESLYEFIKLSQKEIIKTNLKII